MWLVCELPCHSIPSYTGTGSPKTTEITIVRVYGRRREATGHVWCSRQQKSITQTQAQRYRHKTTNTQNTRYINKAASTRQNWRQGHIHHRDRRNPPSLRTVLLRNPQGKRKGGKRRGSFTKHKHITNIKRGQNTAMPLLL